MLLYRPWQKVSRGPLSPSCPAVFCHVPELQSVKDALMREITTTKTSVRRIEANCQDKKNDLASRMSFFHLTTVTRIEESSLWFGSPAPQQCSSE